MRIRTDSAHSAGWHRAINLGAIKMDPSGDYGFTLNVLPAELGDCWPLYKWPESYRELTDQEKIELPIIGYALTCPNEECDAGVHFWDHAYTCTPQARQCNGNGCWTWTGSPANDTLTASPSLHVLKERGGCGWHGFLRNGKMVPA